MKFVRYAIMLTFWIPFDSHIKSPLFTLHFLNNFHMKGGLPVRWTKEQKMMISGGLSVLAVALALLARKPSCWLAAIAMAVSTVGDGLLAGYPRCFASVQNKLTKGGMIFFAAHVLYIPALVVASGQDLAVLLPSFWGPFSVFAALTVLHGTLGFSHPSSRPPLTFFVPAFLYLLTVGVHGAAAVCVSMQTGGRFVLNAAGAVLFYLSDAILLARKYGVLQSERAEGWIWLTYIPAQLCLLLGFYISQLST